MTKESKVQLDQWKADKLAEKDNVISKVQEEANEVMNSAIKEAHEQADIFAKKGYDFMALAYSIEEHEDKTGTDIKFGVIPFNEDKKEDFYIYLYAKGMTEIFTLDLKSKK